MAGDKTRRGFLAAAGSGAVAAIAGCSGNNPPSETSSDTKTTTTGNLELTSDDEDGTPTATEEREFTGGTLRMASPGKVQTLDPAAAKGSGAGYNQYQESLMQFPNGDLPPQGKLATDYRVSNDGKTFRFDLRDDVRFHPADELSEEQQRFTAADVVYSWRRLAGSKHSRNKDDVIGGTFTIAHDGNTDEGLKNYEDGSLAVRAVDETTFEFTMATPFHGAFSQIAGGAFGIIPENAVGDVEGYDGIWDYDEFFGTAKGGPTFVATGPFQVDSWSKGDRIKLTRYEDYYGDGPYIDGITYTVLGSSVARYKRAINENLDIFSVPTSKFDPDKVTIEENHGSYVTGTYGPLENDRTVNYGKSIALETTYILFNCDRVVRPARRAIAHLVDQHEIVDTIFKGVPQPAYHITPTPVWPHKAGENPANIYEKHATNGYRSNTEFGADGYPYGYNSSSIPEAKRIMEAAGYGPDNPYDITFTVFSGSSAWNSIAKLVRDKAKAAHMNISIEKAGFGTIITKAIAGNMDMFSLGDGMEWPESDNFLRFLHAGNPGTSFTRWGSEDESEWNEFMRTADRAWEQNYKPNKGPGKANQQKRNEAYVTIEEMNWASVQELPIKHGVNERWWYDDVNVRMAGPMENQTFNRLTIDRDGT